ncbi:MAG: hypothetical protein Q9221_007164 [Calogaya cf. arnoldii]
MSSNTDRPVMNVANTSARMTLRPHPYTGPSIPHGLDIFPRQPSNVHHMPERLGQLAMSNRRRLQRLQDVAAQAGDRITQLGHDSRDLLQDIMAARQEMEDEDNNEGEESEGENLDSDMDSDAMDVDSDGDDGNEDDDDEDYDGDDDDSDDDDDIEFLAIGSTSVPYLNRVGHHSHVPGHPVTNTAAANAVQQPRPNIDVQQLPSPPATPPPRQLGLRGGRAEPRSFYKDLAEREELYEHSLASRTAAVRLQRQEYTAMIDGVVTQDEAGTRVSLQQWIYLAALARSVLEAETDARERECVRENLFYLERRILQERALLAMEVLEMAAGNVME